MSTKIYNTSKLHKDLINAGIPITGVYQYKDNGSNEFIVGVHYVSDEAKNQYQEQVNSLIASHNPYDYRIFRQKNYWPIGDQLDAQYKGGAEELAWKDHITAVKNRWTKLYENLSTEDKTYVDNYYQNGGI